MHKMNLQLIYHPPSCSSSDICIATVGRGVLTGKILLEKRPPFGYDKYLTL